MSHFKLDFDISESRELPPSRRRVAHTRPVNNKKGTQSFKVSPIKEKETPKAITEPDPDLYLQLLGTKRVKLLLNTTVLFIFAISIFGIALFVVGFWFTEDDTLSVSGSCERREDYLLCHGARGCKMRGTCHFSRLVRFSSFSCASNIDTITTHSPGGDATEYPAHYLRYRNTTAFIVEGNRVLLHPVHDRSCTASVQSVPDNQFRAEVLSQLKGSVIWTTRERYDFFDIKRNGHTVASIQEEIALFTSNKFYRLYKLGVVCSIQSSGRITVLGKKENSEKEWQINAFDFC